ncbi:MAG UNVERIFIED_CONTAM: hypothetical protein LVR18_07875 [Planctomycetaceae bacterium]
MIAKPGDDNTDLFSLTEAKSWHVAGKVAKHLVSCRDRQHLPNDFRYTSQKTLITTRKLRDDASQLRKLSDLR